MKALAFAVALATAAVGPAAAQDASASASTPLAIDVAASPISQFGVGTQIGDAYGELTFLGALRLTSADPDFGGLSGLRVAGDGKGVTIISDRGYWYRGELVYDGPRLSAVAEMRKVATPGRDGKPLPGRRGFDTEGLEIEGKTAWVTAERVHWLTRYALDAEGFPAGAGKAIALPKGASSAASNGGYEAISRMSSGALALIAQSHRGANGELQGYVVGGKAPFAFTVKRSDDFVPTDMTRLPEGGFVLLERRYRPPFSLSVRMRRLAEADVVAGALVDGPVLMEASLAQGIDNFEGISAHRGADGRTVLTVVSDDNFHPLQRTLLMQFALGK